MAANFGQIIIRNPKNSQVYNKQNIPEKNLKQFPIKNKDRNYVIHNYCLKDSLPCIILGNLYISKRSNNPLNISQSMNLSRNEKTQATQELLHA